MTTITETDVYSTCTKLNEILNKVKPGTEMYVLYVPGTIDVIAYHDDKEHKHPKLVKSFFGDEWKECNIFLQNLVYGYSVLSEL